MLNHRDAPRASMLTFEGVRIRSDVVPVLRISLLAPKTATEVAKAHGRTAGAMTVTLKRLADEGLLEVHSLPTTGRFATRWGALTGYQTSDKGRRLLVKSEDALAALDAGEEPDWETVDERPRMNAALVVSKAQRTQPNSVFDLGRLCAG